MVTQETDIVFLPFSPEFACLLPEKPHEKDGAFYWKAVIAKTQLGSVFDNVISVGQELFQQLGVPQDGLVSVHCLESDTSHIAHIVLASASSGYIHLSPVLASNLHFNTADCCHVSIEIQPEDAMKDRVAREVTIARISFVSIVSLHFF